MAKKQIDLGLTGLDELFMDDKERAESKLPKEKMRYVTLNDSELRLAKYALLRFRNMLIAKELPTEDVNALLLKLYK